MRYIADVIIGLRKPYRNEALLQRPVLGTLHNMDEWWSVYV